MIGPDESPELKALVRELITLGRQLQAIGSALDSQMRPLQMQLGTFASQLERAFKPLIDTTAFSQVGDQLARMASSLALVKTSDLQKQIEAVHSAFPDALLQQFSSVSQSLAFSAKDLVDRVNAQLGEVRLDQLLRVEGMPNLQIPEPSPTLAAQLDAELRKEGPVVEPLPTDREGIEKFWLAVALAAYALLWVLPVVLAVNDWATAKDVIAILGALAGLYAAADAIIGRMLK